MICSSNYSGCGFYEIDNNDQEKDCCKPNGVKPYATNCLSNGNGPKCQANAFGGIPSIDGSGSSNVCQGNEAWGEGSSDLMAPINSPCSCFPSKFSPCEIENNHRVCRVDFMLWDGVANSTSYSDHICDECRECMIEECSHHTDVTVNFSTINSAEGTITSWMTKGDGCQGAEVCETKCRYESVTSTSS